MKKLMGLLVLLAAGGAAAQDTEDFRLQRWYGGQVEARLGLGLNLTGAGFGTDAMGGVVSPRVASDATSLFTNPAALGRLAHRRVVFSSRLPLAYDAAAAVSPATIQRETDAFLQDLDFPERGAEQGVLRYTEVQRLAAEQEGQVATFALAWPLHRRLVLAMGTYTPVQASFDLGLSGVEGLLEARQQSGDQSIDIRVLTRVDAAASARLDLTSLSFGAGGTLADGRFGLLTAGVAFERQHVAHTLRWDARSDGGVVLGGTQEYFFNDSADPNLAPGETNAFYWRGAGRFEDTRWRLRAGAAYAPARWLNLSLGWSQGARFRLTDPQALAEGYLPAFINPDGQLDPEPGAADLFDVEALSLAKPNLTRALDDSLGQHVTFSLPSTLRLGVDLGLGPHTLAVNYLRYSGDLSYQAFFGEEATDAALGITRTPTSAIGVGLDVRFPDRLRGQAWALLPLRLLFLDVDGLLFQAMGRYSGYRNPHYRLGGGLQQGTLLVGRLAADARPATQVLPTGFSMGRQYTLFNGLDVGVMLFGVPDMAFRMSLGYSFP
jgi:hypothetical protein